LHYIADIRKLMNLCEAIKLWAYVIMPYQLLFRDTNMWVINPYYLTHLNIY